MTVLSFASITLDLLRLMRTIVFFSILRWKVFVFLPPFKKISLNVLFDLFLRKTLPCFFRIFKNSQLIPTFHLSCFPPLILPIRNESLLIPLAHQYPNTFKHLRLAISFLPFGGRFIEIRFRS